MHTSSVTKVAVLTNRIPDYRRPVFEALQDVNGLELRIFLSAPESQSDKTAQQSLTFHYSKGINLRHETVHKEFGVEQIESLPVPIMLPLDLYNYRPDIIISGEFGFRSLLALLVARTRRIPFVIWTEEIIDTARGINLLQRMFRNLLIPQADAFLPWGEPAAEYLLNWKIQNERIYQCAQAVDNDFWSSQVASCDRRKIRESIGCKGKVFLAVGQLIPRKGFDCFLIAWGMLPEDLKRNNSIVIVGSGKEEQRLKSLASDLGIPKIHFFGHQEPQSLASFYAAADVFVFPSLVDVWGLVVNEAMACGLPVLGSCHTGAGRGLVAGSGAGEVFDPLDRSSFAAFLERWCVTAGSIPRHVPQRVVKKLNFAVTVAAFRNVISDHARHNG